MEKPKKKRKNSKDKGDRAERIVAKLCESWWGSEFARTPSSGGFKTKKFRDDWNAAADLVTPDESFPFAVECKWQESWHMEQLLKSEKCDPWDWWAQAVHQASEGKIPLLVFKRNNQPWYYMAPKRAWIKGVSGRVFHVYAPIGADHIDCDVVVGLFSDLIATEREIWR